MSTAHQTSPAFQHALTTAKQHLPIQRVVSKPEFQVGFTIVLHKERYSVVSADAWDRPEEAPLMPWSPPKGTKIAHLAQDDTLSFFA